MLTPFFSIVLTHILKVMTAATFWSLLLPALEMTAHSNEENKFLTLIPILIGFFFGAGFVCLTDILLPDNVSGKE